MPFVLTAMQCALAQAIAQICTSDQGSHFTSPPYAQLLLAADVRSSQDGKGRALDTILTERLWRTIQYEEVSVHEYPSAKDARQQWRDYVQFDHQQRLHQSLEYQTPATVDFAQAASGAIVQR